MWASKAREIGRMRVSRTRNCGAAGTVETVLRATATPGGDKKPQKRVQEHTKAALPLYIAFQIVWL